MLYHFFSQCLKKSVSPFTSTSGNLFTFSESPNNLSCTVLHLITQLPTDTASGPDDIFAKMLKSTATSIAYPYHLSSTCPSFQLYSVMIGNSQIVPIPQKSSPSSPSNYCPISLLSLVNKLLEQHIFNWLSNFALHITSFLIANMVLDQVFLPKQL